MTGKKRTPKVIFKAKSPWQKDECLFCGGAAVLEAASGNAAIRCCTKASCKERAAEMARALAESFS